MQLFKKVYESIKTFKILFKKSILKFYEIDINTLKMSSRNILDQKVLHFILSKKISMVLYEAAEVAYMEEIDEFKSALKAMKDELVTFFDVDPQFELDYRAYKEYLRIRDAPIQVDFGNCEGLAFDFRMEKLETIERENSVSKSNLVLPKQIA